MSEIKEVIVPTLTICLTEDPPYYLLDFPNKQLTAGPSTVIVTHKTRNLTNIGLTIFGTQVLLTIHSLKLGTRAMFDGTKLRIFFKQNDDKQLKKALDNLSSFTGKFQVTTKT